MSEENKNITATPETGAANVSMETPEYAAELSKETADKVAQIEDAAKEQLSTATDEDTQKAIIAKAEAKKAEVAKTKTGTASKIKTDTPATKKIPAVKITVSGQIVGRDNKAESYEFDDIVLPQCENVLSYMKQAVLLRFKKDGQAVALEDIITYYLDDEQETEMDATFIGKDILQFTEDEVLAAKIYYKLKSVVINQGIRQARVSLYKACCRVMGRLEPDDTNTQIAKWPRFKLSK
nr:MAG TPA: hypothetical protein [Microviridae sp.]